MVATTTTHANKKPQETWCPDEILGVLAGKKQCEWLPSDIAGQLLGTIRGAGGKSLVESAMRTGDTVELVQFLNAMPPNPYYAMYGGTEEIALNIVACALNLEQRKQSPER